MTEIDWNKLEDAARKEDAEAARLIQSDDPFADPVSDEHPMKTRYQYGETLYEPRGMMEEKAARWRQAVDARESGREERLRGPVVARSPEQRFERGQKDYFYGEARDVLDVTRPLDVATGPVITATGKKILGRDPSFVEQQLSEEAAAYGLGAAAAGMRSAGPAMAAMGATKFAKGAHRALGGGSIPDRLKELAYRIYGKTLDYKDLSPEQKDFLRDNPAEAKQLEETGVINMGEAP